eukprot:scaffold2.g7028.t1
MGGLADELLALQLQQQEEQLAAAAQQASDGQAQVVRAVEDAVRKCQAYEDELAQAMALSVLPVDELRVAAAEAADLSRAMGDAPPLAEEDALAEGLLHFFKGSFFSWVNSPPCDACGSADTAAASHRAPTAEEEAHATSRVELYRCRACGSETAFPRYSDPVKLLETRRGRCGEWANAFALCCRALGLEVRLANDLADHVWVEYYSSAQGRWVHADPCEAALDRPLLYTKGWGKALAYVLAAGRRGIADASRHYVAAADWAGAAVRRTLVAEAWLAAHLARVTSELRAGLPAEELATLEERDRREAQQLVAGAHVTAADLALPGRQTGGTDWVAARGEGGAGQQGAAAPASSATRYRWAGDGHLAAGHPRRVCGGAVRASADNAPAEGAARACDGAPRTKWLAFGGQQEHFLEYRLPAERTPLSVESYALTCANDAPERDPRHTVLEAWSEGERGKGGRGGKDGAWVALDEQRDLRFPGRHCLLGFPVACKGVASRAWRLRILSVADPSTANSVQLACWDLFAAADPQHTKFNANAVAGRHGHAVSGERRGHLGMAKQLSFNCLSQSNPTARASKATSAASGHRRRPLRSLELFDHLISHEAVKYGYMDPALLLRAGVDTQQPDEPLSVEAGWGFPSVLGDGQRLLAEAAEGWNSDARRSFLELLEQSRSFQGPCTDVMAEALGVAGLWKGLRGSLLQSAPDEGVAQQARTQAKRLVSAAWSDEALRRGVALAKAGDLPGALLLYAQALELDEANANALVARGAALANQQDLQRAADDLTTALELVPGHSNAAQYLRAVRAKADAVGVRLRLLHRRGQGQGDGAGQEQRQQAAPDGGERHVRSSSSGGGTSGGSDSSSSAEEAVGLASAADAGRAPQTVTQHTQRSSRLVLRCWLLLPPAQQAVPPACRHHCKKKKKRKKGHSHGRSKKRHKKA